MNLWTEIDEEVEETKRRLAARFDFDVRTIGHDAQKRQAESVARGWKLVSAPARKPIEADCP